MTVFLEVKQRRNVCAHCLLDNHRNQQYGSAQVSGPATRGRDGVSLSSRVKA